MNDKRYALGGGGVERTLQDLAAADDLEFLVGLRRAALTLVHTLDGRIVRLKEREDGKR